MKTPKGSFQDEAGQWWYTIPSNGTRQRLDLRDCPTCGEKFVQHHNNPSPFCSLPCKREECRVCGKVFHPGSRSKGFCSRACKLADHRCEQCEKPFLPGKNAAGRFCSKECYYEWKVPTGTRQSTGNTGYFMVKTPKGTPGTKMAGNRSGRWMLEHRYVMQQKLGRTLEPNEHVHHINGDRADNRPENLELWKSKSGGRQPFGVRAADYHCPGCRCPR